MNFKTFVAYHTFELAYLAVLAVLPFIASIRVVATTLIVLLFVVAVVAIFRKITYRSIKITGQTVVVSGCDTGFGHSLAKRLDYLGFTVIAGCLDDQCEGANILRKWSKSDRIHVVRLDVTSDESVQNVLDYTKKNSNQGVWALVNNAAVNFVGDVEFCSMDQYKRVAEVNQFGVIRMTQAFLPLIRQSKGRVVNITSAKGRISLPCAAAYGATKYAVEAFSDVLRLEMRKFGVKVVIVEPGDYGGSTGMLSPKTLKWLRGEMDTMWNKASDEVKKAYGQEYFEAIYSGTVSSAKEAAQSTMDVIDAMEDAVINTCPGVRYLVDGSNRLVDLNNWFIRIGWFLPYSWLDSILDIKYNKGLPKVPATSA